MTIKYLVGSDVWAVRCFLQDKLPPDLEERYHEVTQFIQNNKTDFLVDIEYQPEGLLVSGKQRPICKMQWVEGVPLNAYLYLNKERPAKLASLPDKFLRIVMGMTQLGCAHGDLQHGNILMSGDNMVLIDYDGMYVPAYAGTSRKATELGHRNYQHRQRTASDFNAEIDCFSAISIYLSLCAIRRDKNLIKLNAKEEYLYLREEDYKNPKQSAQLEKLTSLGYSDVSPQFSLICEGGIKAVPSLRRFLLSCPSLLNELPTVTQSQLYDEDAQWVTTTISDGITTAPTHFAPAITPTVLTKLSLAHANDLSSFELPKEVMVKQITPSAPVVSSSTSITTPNGIAIASPVPNQVVLHNPIGPPTSTLPTANSAVSVSPLKSPSRLSIYTAKLNGVPPKAKMLAFSVILTLIVVAFLTLSNVSYSYSPHNVPTSTLNFSGQALVTSTSDPAPSEPSLRPTPTSFTNSDVLTAAAKTVSAIRSIQTATVLYQNDVGTAVASTISAMTKAP